MSNVVTMVIQSLEFITGLKERTILKKKKIFVKFCFFEIKQKKKKNIRGGPLQKKKKKKKKIIFFLLKLF